MHFQLLALSALAALTSAAPSAAPHVLEARGVSDACATQPTGSGLKPNTDSATAFVHFGSFSSSSTIASTPPGYQRTFHNHLQSTSGGKYMGMYTLTSYDTAGCANLCTGTSGCQGFNVYYERDPSLNPAPTCTNPSSTTNIVCTLWGQPPTVVNATNSGQYRQSFQVVIAGSNGYAKLGTVSSTLADDGVNPYE